MANAWLEHVKNVAKQNKGMKFKDVLKAAKQSYKKQQGGGVADGASAVQGQAKGQAQAQQAQQGGAGDPAAAGNTKHDKVDRQTEDDVVVVGEHGAKSNPLHQQPLQHAGGKKSRKNRRNKKGGNKKSQKNRNNKRSQKNRRNKKGGKKNRNNKKSQKNRRNRRNRKN